MSDPVGLPTSPAARVPAQLGIFASTENLGTLRSVHQPASWLTRLQFRGSQIYLYDQGLVFMHANGAMRLFRWSECTVKKSAGSYLVVGPGQHKFALSKGWSGFAELAKALDEGAQASR